MSTDNMYSTYGSNDPDYTISTGYFNETGSTNLTTVKPVTSSTVVSTTNVSSTDVSPQMENQDDEFVFHAMYAIGGAVGFIVLAIVICFVYRSRRIARNNVRRIRPRSRPGALSLELLERDLLESGLPRPAHQPLYGIESAENTDLSEISTSVARENSHKRNTPALETHSEETGTTPDVKKSTNRITGNLRVSHESPDINRNKTNELAENKNKDATNTNKVEPNVYTNEVERKSPCSRSTEHLSKTDETNVKSVFNTKVGKLSKSRSTDSVEYVNSPSENNTYECIASDVKQDKSQNGEKENTIALSPPTKLTKSIQKEGVRKKCPPPVAKKPSLARTKQPKYYEKETKTGDKADLKENLGTSSVTAKISETSSDYEHPDEINLATINVAENSNSDMYINATAAFDADIDHDNVFDDDNANTETVGTFKFDIDVTAPPPPPCNTEHRYVNEPKRCSSNTSLNTEKTVLSYINVPKFSNSTEKNQQTKPSQDVIHKNTTGNKTKSSEKQTKTNTSAKMVKRKDREYANIAKPSSQNLPSQHSEPKNNCKALYVNTQGGPKNQSSRPSHLSNNSIVISTSLDDEYVYMKGQTQHKSDDKYMCMSPSQEGEYLDMTCSSRVGVSGDGSGGAKAEEPGHEYVNTKDNAKSGQYAVPRGNPYKTVVGNMKTTFPRHAASFHPNASKDNAAKGVAERSMSADNVYDYADLRTVHMNSYRDK